MNARLMPRTLLPSLAFAIVCGFCATAATAATLPQTHEYQKVLRTFMATLTEKDFAHGVTASIGPKPASSDPDYQYRNFIYTRTPQPLVGSKRGTPAINAPAVLFTLPKIETPEGLLAPPGWAEATISLVEWDYPGNPYHDNRALKMRAFVGSALNLMVLDDYVDKNPLLLRTDRLPYWLVRTGAAWPAFKGLLPPEVQKAYQDGVRKLAERILAVEPKGEEANLDMSAPVGLTYAARVLNDPAFTKRVEDYSRKMMADPQYLHPAGYWIERGGLDINYSGTTNYFAVWAALMNDWPWANESLAKVYRLRGYLLLPEPNGQLAGPSAFNNRTGGSAMKDQWDYDNRDRGAAMITDEAALFAALPTSEQLATGGELRATEYARQIGENPRSVPGQNIFQSNEQITNYPWTYSILPNYNFPASVNPAFEFYRKGALARLEALQKSNSPLLKSPYARGENFARDLGKAFVVTRHPGFAAIIHVGPVGQQSPDDRRYQFGAPQGFGGGQLSAFWTPATGSAILARRAGQAWEKPFDLLAGWRTWPIHAVSGVTAGGTVFTSARIVSPEAAIDLAGNNGKVKVHGDLVGFKTVKDPEAADPAKARDVLYDTALASKLDYTRTFTIDDKGVGVETALIGDGKESITELYETLPVLLRDPQSQGKDDPKPTIEFQVADKWAPATEAYAEGVKAVRVTRFGGAVLITFDKPRRAKLSSAEWTDNFITRATCRNVMVDLLENGDKPLAVKDVRKIGYRLEAIAKQ